MFFTKERRLKKLVYGVGINDADYKVNTLSPSGDKWLRCPIYTQWKNMMARCYGKSTHKRQPTYVGCSVHPEWHSFTRFRGWMVTQDWEGKQLDKDFRVNGNKVYGPDTCIFLSRKANVACRSNTLYATYKGFWIWVREWCGDDVALYSYVVGKLSITIDLEEILAMREYGTAGKWVNWHGEETALKELCSEYGRDYTQMKERIASWKDTTLYACLIYDDKVRCEYEMFGRGGVKYQFNSVDEVYEYLNIPCTRGRFNIYFKQEKSCLKKLKELIESHVETDRRTLYTIDGVSKYREDWIAQYETTESRVSENISKYKLSFEDAVKLPVQRIRSVNINGEVMLVKDMWVKFGLSPRLANSRKSHAGFTFLQTLKSYGIDTQGLSILPI